MAAPPSTPIRSSIYLIMDGGNDTHTLHRIDTSPLFAAGADRSQHGAPPEPEPTQPAATQPLPHPLARFDGVAGALFLPLGPGVEKIVRVDTRRHTVIFDTRTESVRAGTDARYFNCHGWEGTWAEAGGRLYHLGHGPGDHGCSDFEALTYGPRHDDWFWNLLPSPPVMSYSPLCIVAFADADADADATSTIRISTRNYDCSTYAFDAARASWREEGHWALPFRGRAQYVADYDLWFGFTDDGAYDLCAADLSVAGRPACRHVWANVDGQRDHAGNWFDFYLSYLGSGRFWVTRFFRKTDKDGHQIRTAVVTALEATRAAASVTAEMQMVRRASVRYHSSSSISPCFAY